jgi:hypothetical protein
LFVAPILGESFTVDKQILAPRVADGEKEGQVGNLPHNEHPTQ